MLLSIAYFSSSLIFFSASVRSGGFLVFAIGIPLFVNINELVFFVCVVKIPASGPQEMVLNNTLIFRLPTFKRVILWETSDKL